MAMMNTIRMALRAAVVGDVLSLCVLVVLSLSLLSVKQVKQRRSPKQSKRPRRRNCRTPPKHRKRHGGNYAKRKYRR